MLPGFQKYGKNHTASEQNSYLSVQLMSVINFLKQVESKDFLMFSLAWIMLKDETPLTISSLKDIKGGYPDTEVNWTSFFEQKMKFPQSLVISESYQDSWLCNESFVSIITSKITTLKYNNFYFSDFLYKISKIINSEKKKTYISLIESMRNNYESCLDYSEEIYKIVHGDK